MELGTFALVALALLVAYGAFAGLANLLRRRDETDEDPEVQTERIAVAVRRLVYAAEHRKKTKRLSPDARREWVFTWAKQSYPFQPDESLNILIDATIGEMDELKNRPRRVDHRVPAKSS